ncbi:MAG: hypothetical protein LBQ91_07095 [Oscillospiraceae bacterium]|nr:hypothetical protein [Oscillospiraceae bacterium]
MIGGFVAAAVICFGILAAIGTAEHRDAEKARHAEEERLAEVLFLVTQKFVGENLAHDLTLGDGTDYYAIDYAQFPEYTRAVFKEKFEAWLSEFNEGDIETDFSVLKARGIVKEPASHDEAWNGYNLSFTNMSYTGTAFSVNIGFGRASLWGLWITYEAEFALGKWQVAEPTGMMIA